MNILAPRQTSLRMLAPIAGLVLLGGLTACNDDSSATDGGSDTSASSSVSSSPSTSPSPSAQDAGAVTADAGDPAEALRTILQAYQDGDAATACPLQTKRYTAYSIRQSVQLGGLPAGSTCADTVEFAHSMATKFKVDNVGGAYDVVSNKDGTAVVVHDQGGQPVTYTLLVEDGEWHLDAEDVPGS